MTQQPVRVSVDGQYQTSVFSLKSDGSMTTYRWEITLTGNPNARFADGGWFSDHDTPEKALLEAKSWIIQDLMTTIQWSEKRSSNV